MMPKVPGEGDVAQVGDVRPIVVVRRAILVRVRPRPPTPRLRIRSAARPHARVRSA
jgi:hypothetical protein